MSNRYLPLVLAVPAALMLLSSCSSSPEASATKGAAEAATKPAGPPEPVPAMTAYWEMYKPAYEWSKDLLALGLSADKVQGYKNHDGLSYLWTAVFVSPSRNEARTYTYAVVDSPAAPKGVMGRPAQSWGGATRESMPFQSSAIAINSDAAWKTAADKAGAWLKKHPDTDATISLAEGARFGAPVWFVIWGDKKDGYAAFVNATSGAIMK